MSASPSNLFGYAIRRSRYLNITNRCTLRCSFCPKFNGTWNVKGNDLRLNRDPTVAEIVVAAGPREQADEVVFCGLGEPTLRLYDVLKSAAALRDNGWQRIRVNTDGLANLVYGRDVTPDLDDLIDALSISLNAADAWTYESLCRPKTHGAYAALLDFVRRCRDFVPDVTLTAIDGLAGVDIDACAEIADRYGVKFRRRVAGNIG